MCPYNLSAYHLVCSSIWCSSCLILSLPGSSSGTAHKPTLGTRVGYDRSLQALAACDGSDVCNAKVGGYPGAVLSKLANNACVCLLRIGKFGNRNLCCQREPSFPTLLSCTHRHALGAVSGTELSVPSLLCIPCQALGVCLST